MKQSHPIRIASIDVFRALTMFLMIVVNDFWSIKGVPHWMEHAAFDEDMLGLSDVVFPSFLFILGMSIPLAIDGRIKKGESKSAILKHIFTRSVALLIMGLFSVNIGTGLAESLGISKPVFSLIMLVCFFMIWNVYPQTENKARNIVYSVMKTVAAVVLLVLALIYRDAEGGIFQPRWWGILGLIGWTYFLCATIYLFLRNKYLWLAVAGFAFILLCVVGSNKLLGGFSGIIPSNGCFHALTMCGLLLSLLFNKSGDTISLNKKIFCAFTVGVLFLIAGWITNHWWIISKLQETPPWLFYCAGLSILFYIFIYWLTDMKGKAKWFDIIKPAGMATLTCYLVPSFLYAIFTLTGFRITGFMAEGMPGLLKCVLFSLLAIGITALLGKVGIKLKV